MGASQMSPLVHRRPKLQTEKMRARAGLACGGVETTAYRPQVRKKVNCCAAVMFEMKSGFVESEMRAL